MPAKKSTKKEEKQSPDKGKKEIETEEKVEKEVETKKPLKIKTEEILPETKAETPELEEESSLPKVSTTTLQTPTPSPKPVISDTEEEKSESKADAPKITSFSQIDTITEVPKETSEKPKEEKKEETKEEPKKAKDEEGGKEKMSSDDIKDWLSDVRPDTTKEMEKSGKKFNFKLVIILVVVVAVIALVIGGIIYYKNTMSAPIEPSSGTEATETPKAEPVTTVEEPEVEVDLSTLSVNILNGSGTAGEAGKADRLITDLGFASTKTGNAGSYDFTSTVVQLKEGSSSQVYDKIEEKLMGTYTVEQGDNLSEDSEYDVVITVGSLEAEAEEATEEETSE